MPDQLNVHLLYAALFAPLAGALVAGLMGSLFGGHMIPQTDVEDGDGGGGLGLLSSVRSSFCWMS